MGVKDDGIACGDNIDDVAAEGGDGMCAGRDRADHAERGVFFQRNPVIAAASVGPQPIDARDEFDDLKLFDLVIEPTDFCFLQFETAPFRGVFLGQRLDDFLDLAPGRDAFLLQLKERLLGRNTGFVGIGKDSETPTPSKSGGGSGATAAPGSLG